MEVKGSIAVKQVFLLSYTVKVKISLLTFEEHATLPSVPLLESKIKNFREKSSCEAAFFCVTVRGSSVSWATYNKFPRIWVKLHLPTGVKKVYKTELFKSINTRPIEESFKQKIFFTKFHLKKILWNFVVIIIETPSKEWGKTTLTPHITMHQDWSYGRNNWIVVVLPISLGTASSEMANYGFVESVFLPPTPSIPEILSRSRFWGTALGTWCFSIVIWMIIELIFNYVFTLTWKLGYLGGVGKGAEKRKYRYDQ